MFSLRKPTPAKIARFLEQQAQQELTYTAVGGTLGTIPPGYVVDRWRERLPRATSTGRSEKTYEIAVRALQRWQQFRLGWIEIHPANAPLRVGTTVAVLARVLGLWSLNACRIVAEIDETTPLRKFGFAYGTLPEHAGSGEERFVIEEDAQGEVWFEIVAFSRPHGLLARLGYPYMRRAQRGFGPQAVAAMSANVNRS